MPLVSPKVHPMLTVGTARAARSFLKWAEGSGAVDVRHPIQVAVHPFEAFCVSAEGEEPCAGYFWGPNGARRRRVMIDVAGDQPESELLETLAHELAHYEQWRDGLEISEEGVDARAAELVAQYHEETT
jgi:hypothetical protein